MIIVDVIVKDFDFLEMCSNYSRKMVKNVSQN